MNTSASVTAVPHTPQRSSATGSVAVGSLATTVRQNASGPPHAGHGRRITGPTIDFRAVAQLTATQIAWRERIEKGLRVAEPFLNLLLFAGDRLSRAVDRVELETPERSGSRTRIAPGPEHAGGR